MIWVFITLLLSVEGTDENLKEKSFEEWWESYLESLYADTVPSDSIIDTSKVIDKEDKEIEEEGEEVVEEERRIKKDVMRNLFKSGIQIAFIFVLLIVALVFIRRKFRL